MRSLIYRVPLSLMLAGLLMGGPARAQEEEAVPPEPPSPVSWEEVEVDAEPAAPACPLTLEISPEDAFVMLDGKIIGKAPIGDFECPAAGEHSLAVQKPGHVPVRRTFVMSDVDQTITIGLVEEAGGGKLVVVSDMEGYEISVDGVDMGLVPWEGGLEPGQHEIIVTTPGEQTSTSKVTIEAGETRLVNVNPPPEKKRGKLHWGFLAGAGGLAVAGGVAMLAFGIADKKHYDEYDKFHDDIVSGAWTGDDPRPRNDELEKKGRALNAGLITSLVCLGVGLAATAAIFPFTDFSKKEVEVQASPAGGSISVKF